MMDRVTKGHEHTKYKTMPGRHYRVYQGSFTPFAEAKVNNVK